jgi:hypothetical protein
MMNKNTTALAYGAFYATIYATLAITAIYGFWPQLHVAPMLFMFVCLWVGFGLALTWSRYRRDELHRKYPVSGAENRRRKKQFYDWLRSQGRR